MKRTRLTQTVSSMLVMGSLLLAACASSNAASPTSGTRLATQASSATQQSSATQSPPAPGSSAIPSGIAPQAARAIQAAEKLLSERLNIDPAAIAVVEAVPMQWPDACLGIQIQGEMCTQQIVPGFRIRLEANFNTYEYHTNQDGSTVRTQPAIDIAWQSGDQLETATIQYDQGVTYGQAGTPDTQKAPFADPSQLEDLAHYALTYLSFNASTAAGDISFAGLGTQPASPAEQRMIGEWARLVVDEAVGGRTGAAYGLVFAWHRQGGSAKTCDDLAVYVTGKAVATSCQINTPNAVGPTYLNADQLKQVYTWYDHLKHFELNQTDQNNSSGISIHLVFDGHGTQSASPQDEQEIQDFAAQLYTQLITER